MNGQPPPLNKPLIRPYFWGSFFLWYTGAISPKIFLLPHVWGKISCHLWCTVPGCFRISAVVGGTKICMQSGGRRKSPAYELGFIGVKSSRRSEDFMIPKFIFFASQWWLLPWSLGPRFPNTQWGGIWFPKTCPKKHLLRGHVKVLNLFSCLFAGFSFVFLTTVVHEMGMATNSPCEKVKRKQSDCRRLILTFSIKPPEGNLPWSISHRIHVWYIYLHLVDFYGFHR